ncbi:F0F1 ATP synthase subunit delta [Nocardioides sp. BP30]|uniref:F0F1 ATP synthase subunit delta n=1 Tax=Nocardioides sp. BP30 TaxID=3036374 RepID=UPI002468CA4F|nr:F0F1 ATP synthase subunit delta [Nocardioides sp. BP30]WGL51243.1 F0F1 ATP synthase subunit delta [Nocardioides sp. BP30]
MDVRGASADAVASLTSELETVVSGSGASAAAEVADSLFSASQTLRGEAALRRFLTDQSVPEEAKSGLVQQIFGGKVAAGALQVLSAAATRRWTHAGDLADALEHLSELALVRSAGTEAKRLADELFELGQVVQQNPELRDALSDPSRSADDKAALLDSLLDGKALPATVALAKQSLAGTYRTVSVALGEYEKVAAAAHNEGVATVRVAKQLSEAETSRLAAALERHYGRPVHLNVLVDPSVIGGIKVEIGDDVIDGTVASRLDDARRALAG